MRRGAGGAGATRRRSVATAGASRSTTSTRVLPRRDGLQSRLRRPAEGLAGLPASQRMLSILMRRRAVGSAARRCTGGCAILDRLGIGKAACVTFHRMSPDEPRPWPHRTYVVRIYRREPGRGPGSPARSRSSAPAQAPSAASTTCANSNESSAGRRRGLPAREESERGGVLCRDQEKNHQEPS